MFLYTSGTVHCSSPSYPKVTKAIKEPFQPKYAQQSFPPFFIQHYLFTFEMASNPHIFQQLITKIYHKLHDIMGHANKVAAYPLNHLCPGLSEVALKEATSFANICFSCLCLSTDQPSHLLIMRCWIQDRLLPNSFSWLAFSNCSFNLLNCTSSIIPSK